MPNTKDFIPVQEVKENAAILNDGSVAMVIQTSAVNFDLLSENEQLAIIGSFAALLNSLSFSIQILIRSKKLDISHYLNSLKEAERKQHNPLLQLMMQHYRAFVAAIIRDNEVLDKQFYVVLAVSPIELGVVKSTDEKSLQKALTILNPRRDHILKQLSRIGLKSDQLDDERLIRLYYDIYNDEDKTSINDIQGNPANATPSNAPTKFEHGVAQKSLVNPSPMTSQSVGGPRQLLNQGVGYSGQGPVQAQNQSAQPNTQPVQPAMPATPVSHSTAAPIPAPVAPPAQTSRPMNPVPVTSQAPQVINQQPPARPSSLYSSPQASRSPFVVEELPG